MKRHAYKPSTAKRHVPISRQKIRKLYQSSDWKRTSIRFLAEHPLCVLCLEKQVLTPSTVTDHIKPHRGDERLFWDESNYQAVCKRCHDRKTATADGGGGKNFKT